MNADVDMFGIRKIYQTDENSDRAEAWFLGIGDWETRAPEWNGSKLDSGGILQLKVVKEDGQIRYSVQAGTE